MTKPQSPLRAQGKEPKANYIIIPAAGSLFDPKALPEMTSEQLDKTLDHMIKEHGVRRD